MNNFNNITRSNLESSAQMAIGQAVLNLVDKSLRIIEESIQWSLPIRDISAEKYVPEENGNSVGKVELVRPLPWILFLPSLFILRIFRTSINAAAVLFRYPRIEPCDMIRIIQKYRKHVKDVKTNGLKRQKKNPAIKDRVMAMKEASKSLAKSIRLSLSTLACLDSGSKISSSPPSTKICISNILNTISSGLKEEESTEASLSTSSSTEIEFDEEPLISKIEGPDNVSDSDKDSYPTEYSISDDNEISDSELEVNILLHEKQNLNTEKEKIAKIWCTNSENIDTLCNNEHHIGNSMTNNKQTI